MALALLFSRCKLQTVFLEHARKSRIIVTVPTLKDLDNAERKMNNARLALLVEIDRPQREQSKYRQMVSESSDCIEQYMIIVRQLKKA